MQNKSVQNEQYCSAYSHLVMKCLRCVCHYEDANLCVLATGHPTKSYMCVSC